MVIGFIQWQLYGSQEIVIYSEENNEYKISLHLIQYRTIWIIFVLSIKQGGEDWASREYNHSSLCADKLESIVYSGHNSGIDCAKLKKGWMQSKCWVASIMEVLQLCPERASIKGILIDAHFEWIFRLVVVAPQIFRSRRTFPAISISTWRPATPGTSSKTEEQLYGWTYHRRITHNSCSSLVQMFNYIYPAQWSLEIFGTAPACEIPTTTTTTEVWHHWAWASRGSSCEDGPM